MTTQELIKNRKEELKHLKKLVYQNYGEQLFIDFLMYNIHLYDGLSIDNETVDFINNYFYLYYVDPEYFLINFRNELQLNLSSYYLLLKNEMREEILNISNNRQYVRLATAEIDKKIKTLNESIKNKYNSESETKEDTTNITKNKSANKVNPMSIEANGDFDDLFNWDTSTSIDEDNGTNKSNTTNTFTENSKNINDKKHIIKNIADGLKDTSILTEGATMLVVDAINTISNYIINDNNKARYYLIKKLKPCFINII